MLGENYWFFHDYDTEPIGGGNPYYRCVQCGRSDPAINGLLTGHYDFCEYRKEKEMQQQQFLDRDVVLYLYQNGALVYKARDKGTDQYDVMNAVEGALAIFSVDTVEDAEKIQTSFCRLSRADNETMILPFSGKFDDVEKVMDMLDKVYINMKADVHGQDYWKPFTEYKEACGLI